MAVRPRMKVLKCPGCEVYIRVSGFRIHFLDSHLAEVAQYRGFQSLTISGTSKGKSNLTRRRGWSKENDIKCDYEPQNTDTLKQEANGFGGYS